MGEGKRLVGYIVTSQTQVTEARSLPPGTSSPKMKLIALTQALEVREDQIPDMHMPSYTHTRLFGRREVC